MIGERLRARKSPQDPWRGRSPLGHGSPVQMPASEPLDGVVKFQADHTERPLNPQTYGALAATLIAWRAIFRQVGGIGQTPARYTGIGFGNVSGRIGPFPGAPGARPFLVTGTQTGGQDCLSLADFCLVRTWSVPRNHVHSEGVLLPSSESMTHGAVYDLGPHIRFVFHGHVPLIWRNAKGLRLPCTAPGIAYGTPGMAAEMVRLSRETALMEGRVLVMLGHEDGVIAFGRTAEEAGAAFTTTLAAAYTLEARREGRLCGF